MTNEASKSGRGNGVNAAAPGQKVLLWGASMLGILAGSAAWAQAAYAQELPANPEAAQNQQSARGEDEGEIIVTAQRREQSLTDVPVNIAIVDAETLSKTSLVDSRSLGQVIPGLVMSQKGSFVQPVVRGVSAQGTGPGLENSVAIYFDGVYMSDQLANLFDLSDISRIELLKGPQGTLYGRNAAGGALLISTKDPEIDALRANVSMGFGSFNDVRVNGFINVPLASNMAMSVSGLYHSNDGYYKDILRGGRTAGLESWLVRGKLKWDVSDSFSLLGTVMYSDASDGSGLAGVPLNNNTAGLQVDPGLLLPNGKHEFSHNVLPRQMAKVLMTTLRADVDVAGGQFTMLGAYRRNRVQIFSDADYSPVSIQEFHLTVPSDTYSAEAYYVSPQFGAFNFIVGGTYYSADERYEPLDLTFRPVPSPSVDPIKMFVFGQQKTKSAAAYAEGTVQFTEQLALTAGVRYTDETKKYNAERFFGVVPPGAPTYPRVNDISYNNWTPRASLVYKFTNRTSVFFTYSQGFKSGGFNPSTALPDFVLPEKIKSYEAGFKTRGGFGSFNASAYYYDYRNLQVATIIGAVSSTRNAGAAEFYGLDLDGSLNLTDNFTLNASYSYVDAEYTKYPDAVVNRPAPGGGNIGAVIDAKGNPVIRAPKHTGNISLDYETPAFDGDLTLNASLYFSSGFAWEPGNRIRQKPYQLVSLRAAWRPEGSPFQIAAWVRNLTNEKYIQSESDSSAADGVSYAAPRWMGVTLSAEF